MTKKVTRAWKANFPWGHQGRYNGDAEYRDNCIREGIPQVLYMKLRDGSYKDADQVCWDKKKGL